MTVQDISTEFHKHHRLFIWIGVLLVVFFISVRVLDHLSHVADINAALAQNQAKADLEKEKAAEAQKAQDEKQYAIWKAQSDSRINGLYQQISDLRVSLKTQQDTDENLAAPELAERLNMLVNVPGGYKATPDGLLASLTAAQSTVVILDEVSTDRGVIARDEQLLKEKDQDLTKKQGLLDDANNANNSCKTALASEKDSHQKDVDALKAKNRKDKIKSFTWGAVLGAIARGLVKLI